MSSENYHESLEKLTPQTVELHRAIQSLKEELDAVDWYQQRADATGDEELRAILEHNRDEEKEHASMILEWIRRHDAKLGEALRTYLFTEADVTKIEEEVEGREAVEPSLAGVAEAAKKPQAPVAFTVGGLKVKNR